MARPVAKVQEKSPQYNTPDYGDSVHFREMGPPDIDEIMKIERASFSSPWSARFFMEELKVPYARSFIAHIKERIVGYLIFWELPGELDIHNLAVHPTCRRQGVGRSLLSMTIEKAKNQGLTQVTLEVRKSNESAQLLYRSLGFVAQGVRRGYYQDDGEDALVMVLNLAS
ncbi:MAG: ribosomal protein S18-alanine N-acetyltransferase [Candidatus Binatia bacterium]